MTFVQMANSEGRKVSVPEDMVDAYQGYKRVVPGPEKPVEVSNPAPQGDTTPEPVQEPVNELSAERPKAADVRKWASENGVEVNAKGKIPDAVYEQYASAQK